MDWINLALDMDSVDNWRAVMNFGFHKSEGFLDCVRNCQLLKKTLPLCCSHRLIAIFMYSLLYIIKFVLLDDD